LNGDGGKTRQPYARFRQDGYSKWLFPPKLLTACELGLKTGPGDVGTFDAFFQLSHRGFAWGTGHCGVFNR
jgi:hypothetical protein